MTAQPQKTTAAGIHRGEHNESKHRATDVPTTGVGHGPSRGDANGRPGELFRVRLQAKRQHVDFISLVQYKLLRGKSLVEFSHFLMVAVLNDFLVS